MWRSSSNHNTPKMTRGSAWINFKVCPIYRPTLLLGFIVRSHNATGFPFILSRSGHALVLALFIHVVAGMALQNITLTLPQGTSDHGTPGLLCTPTKWTEMISFYLLNYVAHATTVISRPGERTIDFAVAVIGSLLLPALGLYRGIEAILSGAIFCDNNDHLRKAAKSGALCMLIRSREWSPEDGETVENVVLRRKISKVEMNRNTEHENDNRDVARVGVNIVTYQPPWILSKKCGLPVYVHRQAIHGACSIPPGYKFVVVSGDVRFTEASASLRLKIEIAATYNIVSAIIALAQTVYASLTLYRSRGDQIEQFGYAAFGLTVAPYAVMSIMNLLGNICRQDYATLYMVESTIMDEARQRGGIFNGAVGRLDEEQMPSVCSCTFADGEDVEDLRFSADSLGDMTATFSITAPDTYVTNIDGKSEKTGMVYASKSERSFKVHSPPEKPDYSNTQDELLLLIPSCNPLKRTASPPTLEDPSHARYKISSVTLSKSHYFAPSRLWEIKFDPHTHHTTSSLRWRIFKYVLTFIISLTPLVINGIMSHFQPGSIPASQSMTWRVYTLQWLIFGVLTGLWWVFDQEIKDAQEGSQPRWFGPTARVTLYIVSASPAVGGLVVVGQMLQMYGVCTWLGG